MITNEKKQDFVEDFKKVFAGKEIEEQMLARREMFLWGDINDDMARSVEQKILYFDGQEKKDIKIYLNSPGGAISSGLAIYDSMCYAKSDISTICIGQAASMGAILLSAGTKSKRFALPNSRIMIHQPLGGVEGQATDIEIHTKEILRIKAELNHILAKTTGKSYEKIAADTDRNYFMSAKEAQDYGIIDDVLTQRQIKIKIDKDKKK